ncbi:PLD nuclease N-terminal domain-containing protein [Enterococcus olivae]
MNNTEIFIEYLPFFVPLILLQLILMLVAAVHILKHPNYRFGNRILWLIVVVFLQLFGPILYFTIGKGED